jgi:spore maturation protein CgeB
MYTTDYIKPILASKISIGLLSKDNRDLHTTRSVEIPALGSLLCSQRTSEHLNMYQEGKEAVFWSNADECSDICKTLLNQPDKRASIAKYGHMRCKTNNHFNEPMLSELLLSTITSHR